MKKLIKIITICALSLSLVGCGKSYQEVTKGNEIRNDDFCGGYFTKIVKWDDYYGTYWIVYAKDSNVKYFITRNSQKFGITPLYNADGSLQIYEGE